MNVGIGTEAALFPEKKYITDISFAVQPIFCYKWKASLWLITPPSRTGGTSTIGTRFFGVFLRARIFKRLWSPGIDSKASIPPAYVAWRAGTITLFLLGA